MVYHNGNGVVKGDDAWDVTHSNSTVGNISSYDSSDNIYHTIDARPFPIGSDIVYMNINSGTQSGATYSLTFTKLPNDIPREYVLVDNLLSTQTIITVNTPIMIDLTKSTPNQYIDNTNRFQINVTNL